MKQKQEEGSGPKKLDGLQATDIINEEEEFDEEQDLTLRDSTNRADNGQGSDFEAGDIELLKNIKNFKDTKNNILLQRYQWKLQEKKLEKKAQMPKAAENQSNSKDQKLVDNSHDDSSQMKSVSKD